MPVAEKALDAAAGAVATRAVVAGSRRRRASPRGGRTRRSGSTTTGRAARRSPVADDDPVRMMFTSGTESRPKGALLSSRSLLWQYVSCAIDGGMSADDVELHTLPLYHCAQLDCFLGTDVYLGATSIILPGPDPAAVLRAIEAAAGDEVLRAADGVDRAAAGPDFDATDLSSLRKGYYGASPMPVEMLEEIQQRLPDVDLWNFYGQTEMAPLATILGPDEQLAYAGSAGRAALNVETRIVDDDGPSDVPAGTVGEIVHRSPHATLGYYRDEAKTAEAFRDGWFHSGDLGYVDEDGRLYVVDRKKDMIKTGGENVASREVEEAIYLLDGVAEVAVFGISHPTLGRGGRGGRRTQARRHADLRGRRRARPRACSRTTRRRSTSSSPTRCRRTRAARSSSATCARRTPTSRTGSHGRSSCGQPVVHNSIVRDYPDSAPRISA